MKKFDPAKEFYMRISDADPDDPEPYCSVGVIDWTQTCEPRQAERARLGRKPLILGLPRTTGSVLR
jgi:hypothetical protein